jgi:hypothetical protein
MTIQDDIKDQYPVFKEDFQDRVVKFLSWQYHESDNIIATLKVYQKQLDDIKQAIFELLTERWHDNAVGVHLDILGERVEQPRVTKPYGTGPPLDDEEYRTFIKAKIQVNHTNASNPSIMAYIAAILDRTDFYMTGAGGVSEVYFLDQPLSLDEQELFEFKWIDSYGQERLFFETPLGVRRHVNWVDDGKYFGFAADPDAFGFYEGAFPHHIVSK